MTEADQALLLSMVEQLRDDFAEERAASRESRAGMHTRLDDMTERLGVINTSIAISGTVDAQVRNELDQLRQGFETHKKEIAPSIEEWKRIRVLGLGIVGIIATGGVSFGALVAWGGDTITHWVKAWLNIH